MSLSVARLGVLRRSHNINGGRRCHQGGGGAKIQAPRSTATGAYYPNFAAPVRLALLLFMLARGINNT